MLLPFLGDLNNIHRKGMTPINHLMDKGGRLDANGANTNDNVYTFINAYASNIDDDRNFIF